MNALATVPRETPTVDEDFAVMQIPLDQIDILGNVRANVEGIDGLAASIEAHDVLQPVKVRPDRGRWALVWGQRRFLACQQLGLATIPAIVVDDAKAGHELAIEQLIENVNREDLPPLDRARAMRLVVDAGVSQADLARELGLHPSTIANDLRLLTLDEGVQTLIGTGAISPSHAKAIAALPAAQQTALAKRVVTDNWSSHRLEQEIKWKQDAATQEANKVARTERTIPKVIAVLEKAETPKSVQLFIHGPWDVDDEAVARAVKKAGWTKAIAKYTYGGKPEACDCTAIRVEISGRSASLQPTCTERQRLATELQQLVRRDLDVARSRRPVLELVAWALHGWHSGTWEAHIAQTDDQLLDSIANEATAYQHTRGVDVAGLVATLKASQGPGNAGAGPGRSRKATPATIDPRRQLLIDRAVAAGVPLSTAAFNVGLLKDGEVEADLAGEGEGTPA